ncbi:hypothetical protein BVRB_5g121410 [Beta vulgaris subsp. vulgaris]|nr:hypothetical protein BVRB_5g121410 [Beta vulgaris subsp. vulgaris]
MHSGEHVDASNRDIWAHKNLVSALELVKEEETEEEAELELDTRAFSVDEPTVCKLSETEFLDAEEDNYDEKKYEETKNTESLELNAMKLSNLRAIAKARGMKGYWKLKKSELVGCSVMITCNP